MVNISIKIAALCYFLLLLFLLLFLWFCFVRMSMAVRMLVFAQRYSSLLITTGAPSPSRLTGTMSTCQVPVRGRQNPSLGTLPSDNPPSPLVIISAYAQRMKKKSMLCYFRLFIDFCLCWLLLFC